MRRSSKLMPAGLVMLALVLPAAADAKSPSCGAALTADTVLTRDLLNCPGDGLVAAAPGITIDLNYHRVDGTGSGSGIRVEAGDVTIVDGRIDGFGTGVTLPSAGLGHASLADLNISNNGLGVSLVAPMFSNDIGGSVTISDSRIHHNAGAGVRAQSWQHATVVRDSTFEVNGRGIDFRDSLGGTVSDNRIVGNGSGVAFSFSPGGLVDDNLIKRNGNWGVFAERSALTVRDNKVTFNGIPGEFGGGAYIDQSRATIVGNTFSGNLGDGLALTETIAASRPNWRIERNAANGNALYGIHAYEPGFVGAFNVARYNGEPAQCLNFQCRS